MKISISKSVSALVVVGVFGAAGAASAKAGCVDLSGRYHYEKIEVIAEGLTEETNEDTVIEQTGCESLKVTVYSDGETTPTYEQELVLDGAVREWKPGIDIAKFEADMRAAMNIDAATPLDYGFTTQASIDESRVIKRDVLNISKQEFLTASTELSLDANGDLKIDQVTNRGQEDHTINKRVK